jgi:streptomycin 6-kinase
MRLPADFSQRIIDVHGEQGADWLMRLPQLLDELSGRWNLRVDERFELSYNFVAPATRVDGKNVVLKLGVPGPEQRRELETLVWFDGQGSVLVLDSDREQGAILLEGLSPGTPLSLVENDDEATTIAAEVMASLWKPAPLDHRFPTTKQWMSELGKLRRTFGGDTGPFPRRLVERADRMFKEVADGEVSLAVLHGDLHHENILAAERRPWLAIDPKGVVGEPAYEVGAWLRNPISRLLNAPRPRDVFARRVDILAERLGFDRQRLATLGFAQLVLAAWWAYEDHGDGWQPAIALSEIIEP